MFRQLLTIVTLLFIGGSGAMSKDYTVCSPNGKNKVTVSNGINLSITHNDKPVVKVKAGLSSLSDVQFSSAKTTTVTKTISAPFYRQSSLVAVCRQVDLKIGGGFGLQVRAYDEGVAYRWYTTRKKETVIEDEVADFIFPHDGKAWLAYSTDDKKPFAMAFQNVYDETLLSEAKNQYAFLPATVESGDVKVTILESDLRAYPGMFLKASQGAALSAAFARYPKKMAYYPWRGMSYVDETESFIAKSTGARTYPWRVMAITEDDREMPVNNLVYALATPNQIGDISWIKSGKVAWDWWNDWNLKGVDFKAGINTRTYKYYIDFAARNKIPYVVLDEGWYDSAKGDIMNPIADIDLQGLIDYGNAKSVSIVLWPVFNVLDEHLPEA
jgi:alpha-glucosidase